MRGASDVPLLRLSNVHKGFGTLPVLQGIDLEVAAHEVVALIGPSGSGKSTLLRCVNGLETVDAGSVELLGGSPVEVSAFDADLDAVRRRIGFVFQQFNLFPHMTVLRNVVLAPVRVHGRSRAEARSAATDLLERFGLADKAGSYPDQLSGGQQQRVAIVRALMTRPELLLFDEITSALDPELVGEVLDVVRELTGSGITIVMATHEIGFARESAHRVVFLDGGRIVESGSPADVLDAPRHERTRIFLSRVLRKDP